MIEMVKEEIEISKFTLVDGLRKYAGTACLFRNETL
jgi:hypothetical protein